MSNTLVIIPTYNEISNIPAITRAVFEAHAQSHILFVDDNSPDGTGQLIDEMCSADERIHILHRKEKKGLGRAYIAGFQWALEHDYEYIFEMDADFSHDPVAIPSFLQKAREADLVLGTRYQGGVRVINWPLRRLLLSKGASLYVRIITGMPFSDPTGGYKCFRRGVLETIDLNRIHSNGYSFQIEMTHTAWRLGFAIAETPITFEERRAGRSKMNTDIIREALVMVWVLAGRSRFRRRPPNTRPKRSILA